MNVDINERKISITFNAEDIEDLKCPKIISFIYHTTIVD